MAKVEAAAPTKAPAPRADRSKLTHYHDVERFFRLGMLTPEEIAGYREKGLLPPLPGDETTTNTMVLAPEEAKA
jgi:hypothetical protein